MLRDITIYMKENKELIHLNPPVKIRGRAGLIQSDLWVRDGTIRDNILLELEYDKLKYETLTKILNLEAIFLKFPDLDLSKSLKELSFSEKFMINLARALYRNTSILMIEDIIWKLEDYWKQLVIKSIILEEFSHKTWVIITHNADLLSKANKVVYLNNQQIEEIGTLEHLKSKPCFRDLKTCMVSENKHVNVSMMSESEVSMSKATNMSQMLEDDLRSDNPLENAVSMDTVSGWKYFFLSRQLFLLFLLSLSLFIAGVLLSVFSQYILLRWIESTYQKKPDIFGVDFLVCFIILIFIANICSIVSLQVFSYKVITYLYSEILEKVLRSPIYLVFENMNFKDLLKYFNKDLSIVHVILPSLVSQLIIISTLTLVPLVISGV